MKNRFSKRDPASYEEYTKWKDLCSEGGFRKHTPEQLEGLLPQEILRKANSVLVMASASASPAASVFLANVNRVDPAASAIDQEPYIAVFYHSASAASGGFVHHGGWQGRTTRMPKDFFDAICASGITAHYPLREMPQLDRGSIKELEVDSQTQAFWTAVYKFEKSG